MSSNGISVDIEVNLSKLKKSYEEFEKQEFQFDSEVRHMNELINYMSTYWSGEDYELYKTTANKVGGSLKSGVELHIILKVYAQFLSESYELYKKAQKNAIDNASGN